MSPQRANVVVIEDERLTRRKAIESLKNAGHHLLGDAGDLESARILFDKLHGQGIKPDVVLLDRGFPNKPEELIDNIRAGEDLAPEVLYKFPHTQLVFFSNYQGEPTFGSHRFPSQTEVENDQFKLDVIGDLGDFVTSLPAQALK